MGKLLIDFRLLANRVVGIGNIWPEHCLREMDAGKDGFGIKANWGLWLVTQPRGWANPRFMNCNSDCGTCSKRCGRSPLQLLNQPRRQCRSSSCQRVSLPCACFARFETTTESASTSVQNGRLAVAGYRRTD